MMELVESLDSRSKWAVFVALLENKRMYFNQIRDEFGANPAEVDRILKSLGAGGLVFKHARKISEANDGNRAFYEPSLLGEMFYDSVFNVIIPRRVTKHTLSEEYTQSVSTISQKSTSYFENLYSKNQIPVPTIPLGLSISPSIINNNYERISGCDVNGG